MTVIAKRPFPSDSNDYSDSRSKMPHLDQAFEFSNISDGDTVHQHCLLISGICTAFENAEDNFVKIQASDMFHQHTSSTNWPVVCGTWKALVMLSPGENTIQLNRHYRGQVSKDHQVVVNYIPLLQLSPLHLAILVAKDSPLLIDCPPSRYGNVSTAHSTLDAAIVKLRMTAYMWQALTGEDLYQKGLGRRSFRLDEEWGIDTTTRSSFQIDPASALPTGSMAKVHIVRCDKTVSELRDAQVAQQNPRAQCRDDLHKYFEDALSAHGAPFLGSARPVVAGLILDSHYSVEQNLILGHAALGCHKPDGLSLGVFGSHTTYSWPRFIEEVPACLLDTVATGGTVGNDNGECATMREACYVGQGAFLHEVGHAFGADHTTGIMARGYSKHWVRSFLATDETKNDAKWDLQDVLQFRQLEHFRLPGDKPVSQAERDASVTIRCTRDENKKPVLNLACKAGIACIKITGPNGSSNIAHFSEGFKDISFSIPLSQIESEYDRTQELSISLIGMNGKKKTCSNIWMLLADLPFISIPGSSITLAKQSIKSLYLEEDGKDVHLIRWAMLFNRKSKKGSLDRLTAIDLRVGSTMDGAVLHYEGGERVNCGNPKQRSFGGHASEKRSIPKGASITKVEVNSGDRSWCSLDGIRLTLDNGTQWGYLNCEESAATVLEPATGEKIVGFYGQSDKGSGFTFEFGILTVGKDVELPEVCYSMPELHTPSVQEANEIKDVGDCEDDEDMDEDN